jgi:hypothetical protein
LKCRPCVEVMVTVVACCARLGGFLCSGLTSFELAVRFFLA